MKLYVIGGFLGSGKTTAITNACKHLLSKGVSVAVITNDQGADLVDTGYVRSFNIRTEEVPNGCFCCNYDELIKLIAKIDREEQPQIIFAESVGSCTDLVATIAKPLQVFRPEITCVISVFADASLLHNIMTGKSSFINEEVQYLYKKQLEETDILIINKADLLSQEALETVNEIVQSDYGQKIILCQNSLNDKSIEQWASALNSYKPPYKRSSLQIDYDVYAQGEKALGWLDKEIEIYSAEGHAYEVAIKLSEEIERKLREKFVLGHLKFLIDDGKQKTKLSFTTIESQKSVFASDTRALKVELLMNARIEAEASELTLLIEEIMKQWASKTNTDIRAKKSAAFQPGYPKPRYRFN